MPSINIKLMHPLAKVPERQGNWEAGADLFATEILFEKDYVQYDTHVVVEIPHGYVGFLMPRSSVSNKSMHLCNSIGCIDSTFRGTVKCRFYFDNIQKIYEVGDRIAQLVILPIIIPTFEVVDEIKETYRGIGSFGSTGK